MPDLIKRIHDLAVSTSPDYPEVDKIDPFEQLYAIESTIFGTKAANHDLHRLIKLLQQELNWTTSDLILFWEKSRS